MKTEHVYREPAADAKKYLENLESRGVSFKGMRVLDVGCGTGVYSHAIYERGATQVVGVDREEGNITIANDLFDISGLDFMSSSFDEYQSGEKFDMVFARGVIYYFDDSHKFLRHVRSLLHPCGLMLVSFTERSFASLVGNTFKKAASLMPQCLRPCFSLCLSAVYCFVNRLMGKSDLKYATVRGKMNTIYFPACRLYTVADARNVLEACGFEVVELLDRFRTDFIVLARRNDGRE